VSRGRATFLALVAVLGVAACARPEVEPAAWRTAAPPAGLDLERPWQVGFLVVDGVYDTELTAPLDLFHHTVFHTAPLPGMRVFTVAPEHATVTTFEGLRLEPDYGFDDAPPIDVLVVPSAEGSMDADLRDARLIEWVARVGGEASFVVSLCDGAFVLAAAGLLEGRACTTFPGDQDRFAETFPGLDLRRGVSFVHDGKVLTSQGGARSFDVALYLIHRLYGAAAAQGVARGLVLPWPPPDLDAVVVD